MDIYRISKFFLEIFYPKDVEFSPYGINFSEDYFD